MAYFRGSGRKIEGNTINTGTSSSSSVKSLKFNFGSALGQYGVLNSAVVPRVDLMSAVRLEILSGHCHCQFLLGTIRFAEET